MYVSAPYAAIVIVVIRFIRLSFGGRHTIFHCYFTSVVIHPMQADELASESGPVFIPYIVTMHVNLNQSEGASTLIVCIHLTHVVLTKFSVIIHIIRKDLCYRFLVILLSLIVLEVEHFMLIVSMPDIPLE